MCSDYIKTLEERLHALESQNTPSAGQQHVRRRHSLEMGDILTGHEVQNDLSLSRGNEIDRCVDVFDEVHHPGNTVYQDLTRYQSAAALGQTVQTTSPQPSTRSSRNGRANTSGYGALGHAQRREQIQQSPGFLGTSSAVGFMDEVCRTLNSEKKDDSRHSMPHLSSVHQAHLSAPSWFGISGNDDSTSRIVVDYVLPPRRTADALLESYWQGAHPLLPMINKKHFLSQ